MAPLTLVSILVNSAIIFGSLCATYIFNITDRLVRVAAALVFYFTAIIVSLTLLGAFGALNTANYTIFILLIVSVIIFFAGKKGNDFFGSIRWVIDSGKGLSKYKKSAIILICAFSIVWICRLAATPIWDFDSIAYHMPFVAKYLQDESIQNPYFTAPSGPIGYYPANFELLLAHYLLFAGYDSLLSALNLFLGFFIFLGFYLVLKELFCTKWLSLLCALSFITLPVFARMIGTIKIDIFFTLCFILLVLFGIRFIKYGTISDIILFSLSAGIFLGTRYLAFPYLLLPLCAVILCIFSRYRKRAASFLTILSLGIIIVGGYWYVRNYYITQNPVFPQEVSLFGAPLFKGIGGNFSEKIFSTSILHNAFDVNNSKIIARYYIQETGIISLFILFFYAFSFYTYICSARNSRRTFLLYVLFWIGIPLYLFFYISSPNTFLHLAQNIRYSLPLLFIGIVMIVFVGDYIERLKKILFLVFLFSILINISYIVHYADTPQMIFGRSIYPPPVTGVFYEKMKNVYGQHTPLFSVMEWMDEHIPENAKIGFSGFQLHYPLFGRTLKRDVDYIAVNKCHGCNYHDYRSSGGNIFVNPEYSEWISNIQYYNKEYYVFFSKENTFPDTELHWLKEHPEVFKLLYNEKNAYIFKIKNSR